MGQWIGKGKFVFSNEEKAQYRQTNSDKWHSKWITVFRLKKERLWTDKIIKDFLGKPITHGKYKVFKKEDVKQSEKKKKFKGMMVKRIEKIKLRDEHFILPEKL